MIGIIHNSTTGTTEPLSSHDDVVRVTQGAGCSWSAYSTELVSPLGADVQALVASYTPAPTSRR